MKMLMLYFSGTGNTEYLIHQLEKQWKEHGVEHATVAMDHFEESQTHLMEEAEVILFAYPVHGSMAPMLVWSFVKKYASYFEGKKGIVLATQWMFSGDGGAYLGRILKKCKMDVIAIDHFKTNNNISDVPFLKVKNGASNDLLRARLNQQIELFAIDYVNGRHRKIGDNATSILLGAIQRIPFSKWERKLAKNVKIDPKLCTLCNICVNGCPTKNLVNNEIKIGQNGECTICYKCVNSCPEKAISIMTKHKPKTQYKGL